MSELQAQARSCQLAVIWIDWYAYHVARMRGLLSVPSLASVTVGIELVGGIGVHTGLKFREELPEELPLETLLPEASWRETSHWVVVRLLWRKLSQLDPQVVLVPGYYTLPGIAAALWARLHGATSVLMTESCSFDHGRTWWREQFKSLLIRALFQWAVVGGKAHVDYLHQLNFPEGRIVPFYDVVDNGFFARGTESLRATGAVPDSEGLFMQPFFLYVGRLAEEKNVAALLHAWIAYREMGGAWPLVLVGDGPEAAALKAEASRSAFGESVHFPGLRSSSALLPFYAFAGCFVLPSTREPWGLVVNEAMASSLPVLVSQRCGCAMDLVQSGVNGFIFDPHQEAELTALLVHVSSLPMVAREAMGQASAEIISEISPRRFGESVASIVRSTTHAHFNQPLPQQTATQGGSR